MIKNRIIKTALIDWHSVNWLQDGLKTSTPDNLTKLKNSIKANQFIMPFTVWQENKKQLWILDGHHRKLALEELEKEGTEIPKLLPANFVDVENKKEACKLVLLYSSLYAEIQNKGLEDFLANSNLSLNELVNEINLPDVDLTEYFKQAIPEEQLDDAPEPQKTALSKLGDLFLIDGKHRILCGSALKDEDVKKLVYSNIVDLGLTDLPYNIGYSYNKYQDKKNKNEYADFCSKFLTNLEKYSNKILIFPGPQNLVMWIKIKEPRYILSWYKKNSQSGCYLRGLNRQEPILLYGDYESILFYGAIDKRVPEDVYKQIEDGDRSDVYNIRTAFLEDANDGLRELHTCPKPVKLFCKMVVDFTRTKNVVLDLFLGSGTTLIACDRVDRICYGMEIDPIYIDVILRRYHKLYPDAKVECLNRKFDFDKLWQS
ncbi:MAG TPA: hypothetical protein DCX45_03690 [Acinetobacter junii]|nr:hypothetical protein [Acinetobacter junii]